jgi:hypothetical protein
MRRIRWLDCCSATGADEIPIVPWNDPASLPPPPSEGPTAGARPAAIVGTLVRIPDGREGSVVQVVIQ